MPDVLRLQTDLFEPLDLPCPCVVVDTTDGYVPRIDDIAAQVAGRYPPGRGISQ